MTYLDWAASAPPDPDALEAGIAAARDQYANPSSPHAAGQRAAARLSEARAAFAGALGVDPAEIVFTSGGTESNNAVLLSLLDRHRLGGVERQKARIVTTAIEHSSVYEQARALQGHGFTVAIVKPGPDGRVDPQAVLDAAAEDTMLVSVRLVNNETGAIQDVGSMARGLRDLSRRRGRRILFHTDAVQALGKVGFSLRELDVDAASFSAHKFGGVRGVGALYLRSGTAPGFLGIGGGQEANRRPGTENLPGICAMAAAAGKRMTLALEEQRSARACMRELIEGLRRLRGAWIFPGARTEEDPRFSPWILSLGFPPLPGEVAVRVLDDAGFSVSTGSACSSRRKDHTRVPQSMGIPAETAAAAVRVSIGYATRPDDIRAFLEAAERVIPPLLSFSRGRGS